MDFLKDLIRIQHEHSLHQISYKLLTNDLERDNFIKQYNKKNYCLVKVCNCQMILGSRVKLDILLSTLDSGHNPSLSR